MKFYSTNNKAHAVDLREAVVHSLASDNGLYMPEVIPTLPSSFFEKLEGLSFQEIGFEVIKPYLQDDIPEALIKEMVERTLTFDTPLVEVEKDIFSLELFHGPTLAFKDVGARFMAQLLTYFATQQNKEVTVLVATSGDTGSAVANGFYNVPNVRVIILYPSGKVSNLQEKQFTTLGNNIFAVEVDGTFDDCQRLVKQAFLDKELNQRLFLTSANSINLARLLPQMFYYFYAWSRLPRKDKAVFSVPSGNFGNLTAGLIAKRMGLPIQHFVASTNRNDVVPVYLNSGQFNPRTSVSTISNAMDVGSPSNFVRMLDLYSGDRNKMQNDVTGYSFSDEATEQEMKNVFNKRSYTLDPHGAIGLLGLRNFLENNSNYAGVFLETAHPAKFLEVVEPVVQKELQIPDPLKKFLVKEKQSLPCEPEFSSLKRLLLL